MSEPTLEQIAEEVFRLSEAGLLEWKPSPGLVGYEVALRGYIFYVACWPYRIEAEGDQSPLRGLYVIQLRDATGQVLASHRADVGEPNHELYEKLSEQARRWALKVPDALSEVLNELRSIEGRRKSQGAAANAAPAAGVLRS